MRGRGRGGGIRLVIYRTPASRVAELSPREWKRHFAANPMRSDIAEFSI